MKPKNIDAKKLTDEEILDNVADGARCFNGQYLLD